MNAQAKRGTAQGGDVEAESVILGAARDDDVAAIATLLKAAELPHEDFARHVANFVVARRGAELVGAIGAEVYGDDALLRSLVVAAGYRGRGVGAMLLRELEARGERWGVRRWWLLTTTAVEFFARRGFRETARSDAPPAIALTAEFRELCPSVAVCMARERRSA